jgi:hypothetical protein
MKVMLSLPFFKVTHVKKNANKAVYGLAKKAVTPCLRFNLVVRYSLNNL